MHTLKLTFGSFLYKYYLYKIYLKNKCHQKRNSETRLAFQDCALFTQIINALYLHNIRTNMYFEYIFHRYLIWS